MNVIGLLAPVSIMLALGGLAFFAWTFKNRQYDDPKGDAARILNDDALDDAIPLDYREKGGTGEDPLG